MNNTMMRSTWVAIILLLIVVIVGRGEAATSKSSESNIRLPRVDAFEVRGDLEIAGSATVAPIMRRLYRRFVVEGYRSVMNILGVGTQRGFRLLCQEGRTDVVIASRPIQSHETSACQNKGLSPFELVIGNDALTIVANIENDFIEDVTQEQLRRIFVSDLWSNVNEDWPEEPIRRFIPKAGMGTLDFFANMIFDGDIEALLISRHTFKERDLEVIAQSVGTEINSIGMVGYAIYNKYKETLSPVMIDQIEPSDETVASGDYPLVRKLYVYADSEMVKEKPQLAAFLVFVLNHINQEIREVGYFPANPEILDNSKVELLKAMGLMQLDKEGFDTSKLRLLDVMGVDY